MRLLPFVCAALVSLSSAPAARAGDAPPSASPRDVPAVGASANGSRPGRLVPTLALGFGAQVERFEVDVPSASRAETRGDTRASTMLGLAHPAWEWPGSRARFDGHASLGLGATLAGGRYQLPLREDVTFAYDVTPWLTLRAGLGPGVVVDLTRSAMSYAELGLPVGVTLLGTFELAYRPYLSIPLGSEDRGVFGGKRTLSAGTAFVPLDLALRVRFRAL